MKSGSFQARQSFECGVVLGSQQLSQRSRVFAHDELYNQRTIMKVKLLYRPTIACELGRLQDRS